MNTVSDVFKIYHPLENVKGTRESAIIMEILQEERPDWIWGGGAFFDEENLEFLIFTEGEDEKAPRHLLSLYKCATGQGIQWQRQVVKER